MRNVLRWLQELDDMRELSFFAIVLGVVVGALLAAANAFIGLKIGMTVSASIPAAVVSLLVMRTLLKRSSLLESNMVQTIGSAGESVAAGMIFTLPALFIMGNDPQYLEMVAWGGIGGLLGVCFMVPLRRVLIVKEHGVLPYPEGVACAEVLQSGERGGASAKSVILGGIIGAVYYLINALGFWKETGKVSIDTFRTEAQLDSSPALLGVGYILGPKVAAYMLAGAVLSWFVLIPGIGLFGASATLPVHPESTNLIGAMSPHNIYKQYIQYIGAGAVAIGGLISLLKSFPTIVSSFGQVLSGFFRTGQAAKGRTDRDFPILLLLAIIVGLGYALAHFKQLGLSEHLIGVGAVIVFTFFFVTVSSRLVGIVGSSSSPVSGMTIATILATALVFRYFVIGDSSDVGTEEIISLRVMCLSIGAIVCVAISVAGDTSQDLKTGFLVKATPYKQQIGEMIGVLTSVVAIAGVILLLNNTLGFGERTAEHPNPMLAPQANIMKILVEGVLGGQVPWTLIMMGGATAVIIELLGLSALPFAVGMYLPLGLSTPIMVGGIVHWLVKRKKRTELEHDSGILASSGLVAGQGLMGVALAGVLAAMTWLWKDVRWFNPIGGVDGIGGDEPLSYAQFVPWLSSKIDAIPQKWGLSDAWWDALPLIPFVPVVIWLWWHARKRPTIVPPAPQPIAPLPEPPMTPTDDAPYMPPTSPPDGGADNSEPANIEVVPTSGSESRGANMSSAPDALHTPVIEPMAAKFGPPQPIIPKVQEEPSERSAAAHEEAIEAIAPEIVDEDNVDKKPVVEPVVSDPTLGSSAYEPAVPNDPAESDQLGTTVTSSDSEEEAAHIVEDQTSAEENEHTKLLRRIGERSEIPEPLDPYTPIDTSDAATPAEEKPLGSVEQVEPTTEEETLGDAEQVDDGETTEDIAENKVPDENAQTEIDTPTPPEWPNTGSSLSPFKPKFRAGKPEDNPGQGDKNP